MLRPPLRCLDAIYAAAIISPLSRRCMIRYAIDAFAGFITMLMLLFSLIVFASRPL